MGCLPPWVKILVHFLICLSSLKTGAMGTTWNETDRLALLAFKAKITHDPFGIMSRWNDLVPLCQWYGVKCGIRHKRVTELNLVSWKLGGSISPHIGNLSFLRALRLFENNFVLQIPQEIGRLQRLEVLDLRNNSIGNELPSSLSNCSQLSLLLLGYNTLQGQIPPQLTSLSKLQTFYASENNLTGTLPVSLGNLTSLQDVLLSANNLVGRVPDSLGNLIHLTGLGLGGNNFFGQLPFSLFNLSSLKELDVGINKFEGRLPTNLFHMLPNLWFISFADNKFDGHIPTSLSNASNLQYFQLGGNNFVGKVPSLQSLHMLFWFVIDDNQLGSGDDLSFFCSLTNATYLNFFQIENNDFRGVLPDCITNLSSTLRILSMHSNNISGSIPPSIDNLIGITVLSMDENSFTSTIPTSIGNLKSLALLNLSGNNLFGCIPASIGNLSQLIYLNLANNRLEGTIPSSLQNCTFLQSMFLDHNNLTGLIPPQVLAIRSFSLYLILSHNQLNDSLPEEVGMLTNLYMLDVSSNLLFGTIPNNIGECTTMQILDLADNNLHGLIPSSMSSMKGLQTVNLSSNNLSGQIPEFFSSFHDLVMLDLSYNDLEGVVPREGVFENATMVFVQGNNKLCAGLPDLHLPQCIASTRNPRRFSTKAKVTIGILAGLGCAVVLFVLLVYVLGLRRKQPQHLAGLPVEASEMQPLQFVSYGDLHSATNGFSEGNLVGEGNFGRVYRGVVGEGGRKIVAIKVLNLKHHGASKSFIAECNALRNIRHQNLVKLLTICSGTDNQGTEFKALIYEFMPNGSLEDWLHLPEGSPSRKLGLLERLSLAIDVASLLEYTHHGFGTPLIHCDIKPTNILLDGGLLARVGDFGLSKFLSESGVICSSVHPLHSTGVRGTVGYTPPEYGLGSEVSTQGDVYSYGILVLEMFTGKRPTHDMFKEGLNLNSYAMMAFSSGVVGILDPALLDILVSEESVFNPWRSQRVMKCLVLVIEIGVACSRESPTERMGIRNAKAKLNKIKDNLLTGGRNRMI